MKFNDDLLHKAIYIYVNSFRLGDYAGSEIFVSIRMLQKALRI